VKRTNLSEFGNPRKVGIRAINVHDGDELISAKLCQKGDNILMLTKEGLSIHFSEDRVREMGRTAAGVIGIRLEKKDEVVGCEVVSHDLQGSLLAVCENGYGKRTEAKEYRLQGRGGKGIIAIKTSERNGSVVGALKVSDEDEIMVTTASGRMVRVPVKGISVIGRNTQGVRIIDLEKDEKAVAVTRVEENKEDEAAGEAGESENGEEAGNAADDSGASGNGGGPEGE
jgi:DNA gyrase subunit A